MGKEEKKPARDKPPRPRNAWMLFLCAYHDERKAMREPPLIDPETAKHTKIVSERWKNLPMSEKEKWHAKAEKEKEEHAARYPGYRYQPSKHKKQRTFYGIPKAQRKMQGLLQTAQAKIQQDVGGRLIWVDVAENGQSIAGQVELYDASLHGTLSSSVVGIHPYDRAMTSASHSPVFLRPVAQYTGPLSERTNSIGPDSDDDELCGSAPPESDWENDCADDDDAELQTPDSATYPRRGSGSDPLRIVMTVQNRLGALTEVDAGALPSDPGRPLSPPIPVMQLIRDSRKTAYSSGGERRRDIYAMPEDKDRYVYMPETLSGRERSHSSPTLYSSSSPSPQSASSPVRFGRPPYPPATARPRSSERNGSGPPLASPLAPPLSAQSYILSPYHAYSQSSARKHPDYPPSPSQYTTFREHAPHSAHPYYRPPDARSHRSSERPPSGSAWLPPPGSGMPPLPPARRPSWLPSLARPASPPSRHEMYASQADTSSRIKEEDIDEDMDTVRVAGDVTIKREPDGEDIDELDDDQYSMQQPRSGADAAFETSLRCGLQLAPIRSPPSSPKGDTRLPPIQIPHMPSPTLSPRSLPASAYLTGPAPGSLGQYSPQHRPPASAGPSSTYRLEPISRTLYHEDHRERAVQDSRATPLASHIGPSHTSIRERKAHPGDVLHRERDDAHRDGVQHSVGHVPEQHGPAEEVQRLRSPSGTDSELRSSSATAGADTFILRPARF